MVTRVRERFVEARTAYAKEAALAMRDEKFVPIHLALVGIVDELEVRPDGEFEYTLKAGANRFT